MASYTKDYGKGGTSSKGDPEYVLPGSPDKRDPYMPDMYDSMGPISKYGREPGKQNYSAGGAPNTGIQGSATSSTQNANQSVSGKGKHYDKDYGGPAGNPAETSAGGGKKKVKKSFKSIADMRDYVSKKGY